MILGFFLITAAIYAMNWAHGRILSGITILSTSQSR